MDDGDNPLKLCGVAIFLRFDPRPREGATA